MRTYARLLVTLCGPAVVIVALLMLVTPATVGEPINALPISDDELAATITRLVADSGNPYLTGVCCVNMDDQTDDGKVRLIFQVVEELRAGLGD